MANINGYQAICQAADTFKWPENYKNDLYVHDRNFLTRGNAPVVFGWVLRNHGTHLFDPRITGRGAWTVETLREVFHSGMTFKESDCLFFWYAYGRLQRMTFDGFLSRFEDWTYYYKHWEWTPCIEHGVKSCTQCDKAYH